MKKYQAVIIAICFSVMACKKDRVCNCTVTTNGTTTTHTQTTGFAPVFDGIDTTTSQPLNSSNTTKTTYGKVSKKAMHSNCFATSQESLNESSANTAPGIFTITTTQTGTKKYTCKIE